MKSLLKTDKYPYVQYWDYEKFHKFQKAYLKDKMGLKDSEVIDTVIFYYNDSFVQRGIVEYDNGKFLVNMEGEFLSDKYREISLIGEKEALEKWNKLRQIKDCCGYAFDDIIDDELVFGVTTDFLVIDNNGNCGAINVDGEKIIDCKYEDIIPFSLNYKVSDLCRKTYFASGDMYLAYNKSPKSIFADENEQYCDVYTSRNGKIIFEEVYGMTSHTVVEKFDVDYKDERLVQKHITSILVHSKEFATQECLKKYFVVVDADSLVNVDNDLRNNCFPKIKNLINETNYIAVVNEITFESYRDKCEDFQKIILALVESGEKQLSGVVFKDLVYYKAAFDSPIEVLDLSVRTYNTLVRILKPENATVGNLMKCFSTDPISISKIDKRSIDEVRNKLKIFIIE